MKIRSKNIIIILFLIVVILLVYYYVCLKNREGLSSSNKLWTLEQSRNTWSTNNYFNNKLVDMSFSSPIYSANTISICFLLKYQKNTATNDIFSIGSSSNNKARYRLYLQAGQIGVESFNPNNVRQTDLIDLNFSNPSFIAIVFDLSNGVLGNIQKCYLNGLPLTQKMSPIASRFSSYDCFLNIANSINFQIRDFSIYSGSLNVNDVNSLYDELMRGPAGVAGPMGPMGPMGPKGPVGVVVDTSGIMYVSDNSGNMFYQVLQYLNPGSGKPKYYSLEY